MPAAWLDARSWAGTCCWNRRIAEVQSLPARVSRSVIWPIRQSATLSAMLDDWGWWPATGPRMT
eukprot:715349-Pyramimonas_sp.AAC.1